MAAPPWEGIRLGRRACGLVAGLTLGLVGAHSAEAASIADRSTLQALLVAGSLEDFESFVVASGTASDLNCSTLDAAAVCNGQGPGLVVPGVSFPLSIHGQWNGAGYFGSPSRELLGGDPALVIDFSVPVQAFGVDLRAFSGFPATATMKVFASDDLTPIGTLAPITLVGAGIPVFAGWEDPAGIGRVELTQTVQAWTPPIDNLEFGVVPEPSTALLFAAGLALLGAARHRGARGPLCPPVMCDRGLRRLVGILALIAAALFSNDARAGATIDLLFVGHNGGAIAATDTITVSPGDILTMAARMRNDSFLTISYFSLNYDTDGDNELDVVSAFMWSGLAIDKAGTDFYAPVTHDPEAFRSTATFVGVFQGSTRNFAGPRPLPPAAGIFAGGYQMGTVTWKVNAGVNNDGADISGLLDIVRDGFYGCPGSISCTGDPAFTDLNDLVRLNSATVNLVPEPGTAFLLGLGLLGLVLIRRGRSTPRASLI